MGEVVKQRLHYFDNLKGFAILMVILGHCVQYRIAGYEYNVIFRIVYSFHMPLFFMISGYLSHKSSPSIISIIRKRAYQLLIPYFCFGIYKCLSDGLPLYTLFTDVGNFLWFLWALFFINSIVVLLDCHFGTQPKRFICYSVMLVFVLMIGAKVLPSDILGAKLICMNLQYFLVGYVLHKFDIVSKINRSLLFFLVPASIVMMYFWQWEGIVIFNFVLPDVISLLYRILTAYIVSTSIFLLFREFLDRKIVFLSPLGQATLGIYAVHFFILKYLNRIDTPILLELILVALISLGIVYIIRRSRILKPLIGEVINK